MHTWRGKKQFTKLNDSNFINEFLEEMLTKKVRYGVTANLLFLLFGFLHS